VAPKWCWCVDYIKNRYNLRTTADAKNMGPILLEGNRFKRVDAPRAGRETVVIIDPQGGTGTVGNTDVAVSPGDILTFRIRFTPVPNGATRGLGGYITDYIPQNTEVVGARIVDADGNTVPWAYQFRKIGIE